MRYFLKFFCCIVFCVLCYFFYSFKIFDTPKITFTAENSPRYNPIVAKLESLFCFQTLQHIDPLDKNELKIVVWNLYKGQKKEWKMELENLAQNSDFLFLQEVSRAQNIPQILQEDFPISLYASSFSYLNQEFGVNILSKTLPKQYCAGTEGEPWIQIPKIGISSTYPLANTEQSLLVVNLHLVNFEWTPTNYRNQLTALFQLIAQHDGPILLVGDFNSWNSKRLELITQLAQTYQLTPASFSPDHRLQVFNKPLDHVFTRGFKIIEATTRQIQGSDHNPMLLTLKFDY